MFTNHFLTYLFLSKSRWPVYTYMILLFYFLRTATFVLLQFSGIDPSSMIFNISKRVSLMVSMCSFKTLKYNCLIMETLIWLSSQILPNHPFRNYNSVATFGKKNVTAASKVLRGHTPNRDFKFYILSQTKHCNQGEESLAKCCLISWESSPLKCQFSFQTILSFLWKSTVLGK